MPSICHVCPISKRNLFFFFLETYLVLMNSDAYPHIYLLDSWIFRRFPFFFQVNEFLGFLFCFLEIGFLFSYELNSTYCFLVHWPPIHDIWSKKKKSAYSYPEPMGPLHQVKTNKTWENIKNTSSWLRIAFLILFCLG